MESMELYPGIRLNSILDERFKCEYLSVNFITPSLTENHAKREMLPGVLKYGTGKHPTPDAFNRALEDAYDLSLSIKSYGKANRDILSFSVSWISEKFLPENFPTSESALSLLFEVICDPVKEKGAFPLSNVENEKRNMIDALKSEKNNKVRYTIRQCFKMMCPHSYAAKSHEEKTAQILGITPDSLYLYYSEILKKAQIEIFYVGRSQAESISAKLKKYFSSFSIEKEEDDRKEKITFHDKITEKSETADANQSVLAIGFKSGILPQDQDYPAFIMMREILADSPVSLLFMNVREKENLCYFCDISSTPAKGLYIFYCGIDKKNRNAAQKAIFRQVEKMKQGDFSEKEIENALKARINRYRSISDSPVEEEAWYLENLLYNLKSTPEEAIKELQNVTKQQIINAANSLCPDSIFFLEADGKG